MLSITEQIKIVKGLLIQAEKSYRTRPEGTLVIAKRKSLQYYQQRISDGNRQRNLIAKSQEKLIARLAQADYERSFIRTAKALLKELELLQKLGGERSAEVLYDELSRPFGKLNEPRKILVTPYILPEEEYIKEWLSQKYDQKMISQETTCFLTEKGENVRSKSEMIIADRLHHLGIPYRYEQRLTLQGFAVHPDFTLLNVRERTVCYYEHFGMMQNPEYCRNALNKIARYERAGFRQGKEFFCTFESEENPLDTKLLEKMFGFLVTEKR